MSKQDHVIKYSGVGVPVAHAMGEAIPASVFTSIPSSNEAIQLQQFTINEGGVRDYLSRLHWPYGLQDAVVAGLAKVPLRYFICDDSGSMNESDGSRLVFSSGRYSFVKSTRWAELTQALHFHVELAAVSGTSTEFRLLNSASPIVISPENPDNMDLLKGLFDGSPGGGTPLCRHIREVIDQIRYYEPVLRAHGQKACVIIATDGESSDGDVASAMKPLEQLPCWVVVRLCTNDEKVVNYWNNIDSQLELEMDVLDDFESEAREIYEKNNWFTYAEPLHRIREFGIPSKAVDMLDEKTLTGDSVRVVAATILGGSPDSYTSPDADCRAFLSEINSKQLNIPEVWDPVLKRLQPWFKKKELLKLLNAKGDCIIM